MHGLIFVTWERYLTERFGSRLVEAYRAAIGETAANAPLTQRLYDDALLLAGLEQASTLTRTPPATLLREYGHYFMLNGLTSHLCAYLLNQVRSGRELLLLMRTAHEQMSRTAEAITPPLFAYETSPEDPNGLVLIYDSPRHLCPLLLGAIEGAAERYGESVWAYEQSCMRQGAATCRFEMSFVAPTALQPQGPRQTPEQRQRWRAQKKLDQLVYSVLPEREEDGITLAELRERLRQRRASPNQLRPYLLLEALAQLHHAGFAASTANQPGDTLSQRRYWRVP
jgi:hypothetical protein